MSIESARSSVRLAKWMAAVSFVYCLWQLATCAPALADNNGDDSITPTLKFTGEVVAIYPWTGGPPFNPPVVIGCRMYFWIDSYGPMVLPVYYLTATDGDPCSAPLGLRVRASTYLRNRRCEGANCWRETTLQGVTFRRPR